MEPRRKCIVRGGVAGSGLRLQEVSGWGLKAGQAWDEERICWLRDTCAALRQGKVGPEGRSDRKQSVWNVGEAGGWQHTQGPDLGS